MSTAAGWYHAEGDPPGTTRYWDGSQWIGEPVAPPATSPGSRSSLASPGQRIGARLVDLFIFAAIALAFLLPALADMFDAIGDLPSNASDAEMRRVIEDSFDGRGSNFLLGGVGVFLWEWLFVAFKGGTPGKLMLGIRITDAATGETPPSLAKSALRTVNHLAPVLAAGSLSLYNGVSSILGLVGLASLIMLFADSQHRTVMDRVASTVVRRK